MKFITALSVDPQQRSESNRKFHVSSKQDFLQRPFCCKLTTKLCFRFPNCNNVYCTNVQQPNNQFQNSKKLTANCWNIRKTLCFINRHHKRWLYTSFINWPFDVKKKMSWRTKFQATQWNNYSTNPRPEICSHKSLQPPTEKNLRSDVWI